MAYPYQLIIQNCWTKKEFENGQGHCRIVPRADQRDIDAVSFAQTYGPNRKSNATLIVSAVNNYQRLLNAHKEILAIDFQVTEPNGADIPDHLDAFIDELQGAITEMQHIAYAALSGAREEDS